MSIIEDAFKILTEEYPGALEAIGKGLVKAITATKGWFGPGPTLGERKKNLSEFIAKVADDSFGSKHPDIHGYLGALMALAAASAQLASRGAALEKFHLPGYRFYFPVPKSEPSLEKGVRKTIKDLTYRLKYKDDTWYSFYAIKLIDGHPTIAELQSKVSAVARSNPAEGETATVIAAYKKAGHEVLEVNGIVKGDTGVMYFARKEIPADIRELRSLSLDFTESGTRKSVARDLKEAIDFKLVP